MQYLSEHCSAILSCLLMIPVLLITLTMLFGCTEKERPKKVSLYKKAAGSVDKTGQPRKHTVFFGFDLRLGPKEEVRIYRPFIKYLEKETGRRFRIRFSGRYEEAVDNLGRGTTDVAAIGTLGYFTGKEKYGIKYLASGLNKEGDPVHRAVIFTAPKSDIRTVRDIKGKCFSFGSEMSTEGHLIPRMMLEDRGIGIDDLNRHVYTGSHMNAVKSVLNRECDAGGIIDVLAERLALKGEIKILSVSSPYPGSLIAYNADLDSSIVDAIKKALIAFEPVGKHEHMLIDWDITEMPLGFSEIAEPELEKIRDLAKRYGLIG